MDFELERIRLGWNAERQLELESLGDAALVAARVVVEHRGAYGLAGCAVETARPAGRLRGEGGLWPTVGDWVAVVPAPGGGVIHHVLARTSRLERKRPGANEAQAVAANVDVVFAVTTAERPPNLRRIERTLAIIAAGGGVIHHVFARTSRLERKRPGANEAQAVAANVDVVFAVTTAERPPNLRRVERTLAIVAAGGARPAVVLNKIDVAVDAARDPEADLLALASVSGGAPCFATSAATGAGIEALRALLPPGATGALIGPSGAGKSSLINALIGGDRLATGAVRVSDAKGRHTTTRRELLELPGGGCLIDTPGMRELGLWDAGEGIEQTFGDLAELAEGCRFRDCTHSGEPGCAVAAALESGALDADRFASFEKLRREDAFHERQQDPRSAAASKGRWKTIHKQQRARRRVDPKLSDD